MPLGYSGIVTYAYGLGAPAGATYTRTATTVPAGEIWVLQHASMWDADASIAAMSIHINRSGYSTVLAVVITPTTNTALIYNGALTMEEGDYVTFFYNANVEDDRVEGGMWAMRIDIDQ